MVMIYIQVIGCGIGVVGAFVLGLLLRKYPTDKMRKITTMIMHFVFFVCWLLPVVAGFFYICFASYDELLGIPSLPYKEISVLLGSVMLLLSFSLIALSNLALLQHGHGTAAFVLTKNVVERYVFKLTRNPMSLGAYLGCLAFGLLTSSTYFTLWVLIEVIPSHIFFLKFFEEKELELRFGQSYLEYKKGVPFLIPNIRNITESGSANNKT